MRSFSLRIGRLHRVDRLQVALVLVLLGIGLLTVYSASALDFRKQALSLVLGAGCYLAAALADYRRLQKLALPAYATCLLLLLLVHFAGHSALGARRWLSLGGFQIEPSELAKLALLLALAQLLTVRADRLRSPQTFAAALGLAAPPALLVLLQPDLGTAMVFGALLAGLLFLGGASRLHLAAAAAVVALALPLLPHLLHGYQRRRLEIFLNPASDPLGAGYNLLQARIAVGSGGLAGEGWLHGLQGALGFVPERATDFIFAVYAEQFGLLGALLLIGLFAALVVRLAWSAALAPDRFGYLLTGGVAVMLLFQVFENIGMNIGLTPIAGIPLPFISYGGSALVCNLAALGVAQSVMLRRRLLVYRTHAPLDLTGDSGTVRLDPSVSLTA